jgi:hypothetical protein
MLSVDRFTILALTSNVLSWHNLFPNHFGMSMQVLLTFVHDSISIEPTFTHPIIRMLHLRYCIPTSKFF